MGWLPHLTKELELLNRVLLAISNSNMSKCTTTKYFVFVFICDASYLLPKFYLSLVWCASRQCLLLNRTACVEFRMENLGNNHQAILFGYHIAIHRKVQIAIHPKVQLAILEFRVVK